MSPTSIYFNYFFYLGSIQDSREGGLKSVGLLASDLIFKLSSHVEMAKIPFIKTLRGQSHHYCTPRVENSIGNKVLM